MLKSLFRKIAALKEKVQKGSKFDKINLADDVKERSPLVTSVVNRNARIFNQQVLRTDVSVLPEDQDINQAATLALQEFIITSVAKNPSANLITIEIEAGLEEDIEVIGNHIVIIIEDEASDHASIKALIESSLTASALITVSINAGQEATIVEAQGSEALSGAIG